MMKIKVKVFATLRDQLGWKEKIFEVRNGVSVRGLIDSLPLIKSIIMDGDAIHEHYRVFVNGRYLDFVGGLDKELKDGDVVTIFPALAGG